MCQRARHCAKFGGLLLILFLSAALPTPVEAVTPQSPEVLAVVDRGLKYLETHTDEELGGKCLIGLAFYKRGRPKDHPAILAAIKACEEMRSKEQTNTRIYSKAIAVIFLTEIDAKKYRPLIQDYAKQVVTHQMPHGGFGYRLPSEFLGDTSQTQYAALAYWQMLQTGVAPDVKSVEACTNWLLRTQAPEGGWTYKGQDPDHFSRVEQSSQTSSMLSAGLGSVLICGNMLGMLKPSSLAPGREMAVTFEKLPPAVRRVEDQQMAAPTLNGSAAVEMSRLERSIKDGRAWWDKNFQVDNSGYYPHYGLYALERYKSFEEYLEGNAPEEPEWYNRGWEYLRERQEPDGKWTAYAEASASASTAFSVLFLLRSTQASIKERLGEGTLVGGRGLPRDLSKVKLRGGRIVVEQKPTDLDQLLEMLEQTDAESGEDPVADILGSPGALVVGDVGPAQLRQLDRLARQGKASERLVAVEALGRVGTVDVAPTLIFALSDPDRRVVRAARDALQLVSREFEGFGPPDNFEDSERRQAIDQWKGWYLRLRPGADLP